MQTPMPFLSVQSAFDPQGEGLQGSATTGAVGAGVSGNEKQRPVFKIVVPAYKFYEIETYNDMDSVKNHRGA